MDWVVYILKCGDGSLYTGITNELDQRIKAHEEGTGAKYTRGRGPFKLVYREDCENRSAATKREMAIKRLSKDEKMAILQKI